MAEVARLEVNVRARVGRAIAQLRALNQQIGQVNRNSQVLNQASQRLAQVGLRQLTAGLNNASRAATNANKPIRTFRQELDASLRDTNRFISGVSRAVGSLRTLLMTFLAFSSFSLAPIFIGLTGLLGVLTSITGVAAVSLGAFFAAVMGSKRSKDALDSFTDSWRAWQESVADVAAPPVEHFFGVLANNLTKLNPLVTTTSKLLLQGSKAFERFLQTDQFNTWLEDVRKASETMLPNLGGALGNFLIGLMEIIRAFIPMGESFSDWLLEVSARFRAWAEGLSSNKAFQDFSDWLYANAPKMASTLKQVFFALWDLAWALRDIGMISFEVFGDVARYISNLDSKAIVTFAGALILLSTASSVLGFVSGLAQAFAGIGPALAAIGPQAIVIGIVIAIAAAFYVAWQRSEAFRKLVREKLIPVFEDIITQFGKLYESMGPVIDIFLDWLVVIATAITYYVLFWSTIYLYGLKIATFMFDMLSSIGSKFSEVWNSLPNIAKLGILGVLARISPVLAGILAVWSGGWNTAKKVFTTVWNGIVSVGRSAWNLISGIVTGIWNTVSNWVRNVTNFIRQKWNDAWNFFTQKIRDAGGLARAALLVLKQIILMVFFGAPTWLFNAGKDIIRGLISGISSMAGSAVNAVKNIGSSIVGGITSFLGIRSPSRVFMEIGGFVVAGLNKGIEMNQRFTAMQSTSLAQTVVQPFNTGSPRLLAPAPASTGSTGDSINISFDGAIITGNPREIEDMVVNAIVQAQRKGRIRGVRTV